MPAAATKLSRKPASTYYFVPEIWGKAPDYTTGQLDQTCATTTDDGILAWCRWLRFNNPGPNGQNSFNKAPRNDKGIVPLFVMPGEGDNIIGCDATIKSADGSSRDQNNPLPSWCLSQSRGLLGSLQVGFWPVGADAPAYHPAIHMSLPGQTGSDASVDGGVTPNPNLIFANSTLYDFMNQAFTLPGALPQGCSQQVMWDASR